MDKAYVRGIDKLSSILIWAEKNSITVQSRQLTIITEKLVLYPITKYGVILISTAEKKNEADPI